MGRRDLVTGLVVGALGVGYVAMSARLPASGATRTELGPRVYPLVIGGMLLLAVAVLLVTAGARREGAGDDDGGHAGGARTPARWGRMAAVFVATCGYLWLLGILGFVIATTLFLAVCMYLVDGRRRYRGVRALVVPGGYGLATSLATYLVFDQLLGVLLPPGLLVPAVLG